MRSLGDISFFKSVTRPAAHTQIFPIFNLLLAGEGGGGGVTPPPPPSPTRVIRIDLMKHYAKSFKLT